ncbi:MAG: dephospho-CoA kinase [Firmicutes bacterium]|nr:dephospho-CoA kinase [Bacillota bacterium]MDY6160071.1 dephospho-CoA kinase [Candidatus Faecousia sp.]
MILGITGGTGCGKTTLLQLIRQRGGLVLDCDEIYHRLLEADRQMLAAIKNRFPQAFPQDFLDRKALGKIVFADPAALEALNGITHRAVRQEVLRQLEASPPLAAIDAIGLFESGLDTLCDITVAVTAPLEARVARLMARDGISEDYARSRIDAQHDEDWFRQRCDYILENNASAADFLKKSVAFLDAQGIM